MLVSDQAPGPEGQSRLPGSSTAPLPTGGPTHRGQGQGWPPGSVSRAPVCPPSELRELPCPGVLPPRGSGHTGLGWGRPSAEVRSEEQRWGGQPIPRPHCLRGLLPSCPNRGAPSSAWEVRHV